MTAEQTPDAAREQIERLIQAGICAPLSPGVSPIQAVMGETTPTPPADEVEAAMTAHFEARERGWNPTWCMRAALDAARKGRVAGEERPTVEHVAWVFRHVADNMREGGTFRYLIYDRMGFAPSAYEPLYRAGGMALDPQENGWLPPSEAEGLKSDLAAAKTWREEIEAYLEDDETDDPFHRKLERLIEGRDRLRADRDALAAKLAEAERRAEEHQIKAGKYDLLLRMFHNHLAGILPADVMERWKDNWAILLDSARHEVWRCKNMAAAAARCADEERRANAAEADRDAVTAERDRLREEVGVLIAERDGCRGQNYVLSMEAKDLREEVERVSLVVEVLCDAIDTWSSERPREGEALMDAAIRAAAPLTAAAKSARAALAPPPAPADGGGKGSDHA